MNISLKDAIKSFNSVAVVGAIFYLLNRFVPEQAILQTVAVSMMIISFYMAKRVDRRIDNRDRQELIRVHSLIQKGCDHYLLYQYSYVAAVITVILLSMLAIGCCYNVKILCDKYFLFFFAASAVFVSILGYICTIVTTDAGLLTAASVSGFARGFGAAYESGAKAALMLIGLSLSFIGAIFFVPKYAIIPACLGVGFGSSLVALICRISGGIFTKGADVGADIVGKLDAAMQEDDSKNPASVADNIGDHVGDCVGMATNLVSLFLGVVAIIFMFCKSPHTIVNHIAIGISTVSLVVLSSKLYSNDSGITISFFSSTAIALIFSWGLFYTQSINILQLRSMILGIIAVSASVATLQFFTSPSFSPTRSVARAAKTSAASNIIAGISEGMIAASLICLIALILLIYSFYGRQDWAMNLVWVVIAIILLIVPVLACDAYGPIADSAGGIVELSHSPGRDITDALDIIGNSTKAITKGYAFIVGAVTIFILMMHGIDIFTTVISNATSGLEQTMASSKVVIGIGRSICGVLVGAISCMVFTALSMSAVYHASSEVVDESKRQISRAGAPDYFAVIKRLIYSSIVSSLKVLTLSFLPILVFVSIFLFSNSLGNPQMIMSNRCLAVLSVAIGVALFSLVISIFMSSTGGILDNAKKYIEMGNFGGKRSQAHSSAVTGDVVGDPMKDTAGPSLFVYGVTLAWLAYLCITALSIK